MTTSPITGETSLTGTTLKETRRVELDMTQEKLAEVMGVSKPTIARYEAKGEEVLPKLFSWAFGGVVYHHRAAQLKKEQENPYGIKAR